MDLFFFTYSRIKSMRWLRSVLNESSCLSPPPIIKDQEYIYEKRMSSEKVNDNLLFSTVCDSNMWDLFSRNIETERYLSRKKRKMKKLKWRVWCPLSSTSKKLNMLWEVVRIWTSSLWVREQEYRELKRRIECKYAHELACSSKISCSHWNPRHLGKLTLEWYCRRGHSWG